VLSGRGLCDELIIRPEESYRLCCVVVCDLETSRIGAPYMYDISRLKVKFGVHESMHRNIIVKITNKMQLYRFIYYSKSALHVSGNIFAHQQKHLTVFTVSGSVRPSCCRLVSWMS